MFYGKIWIIIQKLSLLPLLIWSTGVPIHLENLLFGCGVGTADGPGVGFRGGVRVDTPGCGWAVGMLN